jgi:hypothetical protein
MRLVKNEEMLLDEKVNEIEKYIDDNIVIIEDFFINLNKLKTKSFDVSNNKDLPRKQHLSLGKFYYKGKGHG